MDLDNEELEATKKLQEKTADEMMKDLGYEIEYFENGVGYYIGDEENIIEILKNVETNKPEIWINDDFHAITMEELKAIYKKCKEEGYIMEEIDIIELLQRVKEGKAPKEIEIKYFSHK